MQIMSDLGTDGDLADEDLEASDLQAADGEEEEEDNDTERGTSKRPRNRAGRAVREAGSNRRRKKSGGADFGRDLATSGFWRDLATSSRSFFRSLCYRLAATCRGEKPAAEDDDIERASPSPSHREQVVPLSEVLVKEPLANSQEGDSQESPCKRSPASLCSTAHGSSHLESDDCFSPCSPWAAEGPEPGSPCREGPDGGPLPPSSSSSASELNI